MQLKNGVGCMQNSSELEGHNW